MKKIMFNDRFGLTKAVLDGKKTMTRRKVQFPISEQNAVRRALLDCDNIEANKKAIIERYAQYQVGEEVAVAQPYKTTHPKADFEMVGDCFMTESAGWDNKMFVRADLMPHRIRITNIKLERLQDISDEDCMKEGVMKGEFMNTWDTFYFDQWGDVPNHITFKTPREAFASLINRTSGRGTWERNPWVFAYEFKMASAKKGGST